MKQGDVVLDRYRLAGHRGRVLVAGGAVAALLLACGATAPAQREGVAAGKASASDVAEQREAPPDEQAPPDADADADADGEVTGDAGSGGIGSGAGRTPVRRDRPLMRIEPPRSVGGSDEATVRTYIKRNATRLLQCYEKQLLTQPTLEGTVNAWFAIANTGGVVQSRATGMNDAVASCIAAVIKTIGFPRPTGGGGMQVTYSFTFRPTGG